MIGLNPQQGNGLGMGMGGDQQTQFMKLLQKLRDTGYQGSLEGLVRSLAGNGDMQNLGGIGTQGSGGGGGTKGIGDRSEPT